MKNRMSKGAEEHQLAEGTSMKTNAGLSKSLRTGLVAGAAGLSVSAASFGEDSHPSRHFVLPASTENVQWGWYDIKEKPKITKKSSESVSIENLAHSLGQ